MTHTDFSVLTQKLSEMPESVRQLMRDLTESEIRWKPKDAEFSVVEHVCHLRDIEIEGYASRIEKLLHEEAPFLPDVDGGKLAAERDYNEQSLDNAWRSFSDARLCNVRSVAAATPAQRERCGTFEGVGEVTLEGLLSMMSEHDETHLRELGELREALARRRS